jgi:hypothetical protein
MVVQVFVPIRNLLGDSYSSGIGKWGRKCRRSSKPTLKGENQRPGLNWLCLVALLKTLFCERGLSPRLIPMIYDGRQWSLCTVSFLEASLLEKLDFWCCLGGVCTTATRNRSL